MRLEEEAPWRMGLCFYLKWSCQQKKRGNSAMNPPPQSSPTDSREPREWDCACRDHRLTHYKRRENEFSVRALRNWISTLAGPTLDPGLVKPFSSLFLSVPLLLPSFPQSPFPSLFSTVPTPHPFKHKPLTKSETRSGSSRPWAPL